MTNPQREMFIGTQHAMAGIYTCTGVSTPLLEHKRFRSISCQVRVLWGTCIYKGKQNTLNCNKVIKLLFILMPIETNIRNPS